MQSRRKFVESTASNGQKDDFEDIKTQLQNVIQRIDVLKADRQTTLTDTKEPSERSAKTSYALTAASIRVDSEAIRLRAEKHFAQDEVMRERQRCQDMLAVEKRNQEDCWDLARIRHDEVLMLREQMASKNAENASLQEENFQLKARLSLAEESTRKIRIEKTAEKLIRLRAEAESGGSEELGDDDNEEILRLRSRVHYLEDFIVSERDHYAGMIACEKLNEEGIYALVKIRGAELEEQRRQMKLQANDCADMGEKCFHLEAKLRLIEKDLDKANAEKLAVMMMLAKKNEEQQ